MNPAGPWHPGAQVTEHGDKTAVQLAGTDERRSYRAVDDTARRVARLLRDLGLVPGDHAALWFDNELDYPSYWWGAHYAGLHYTLISANATADEAAYIVADSGAGAIVLGRRQSDTRGESLKDLVGGSVVVIADVPGPVGLGARLASSELLPDPLVEGAAMLYSSGTTGRPKGVKRSLTSAPLGTSPGVGLVAKTLFGMSADSVYLSPAPLYHAAPYGYVSAATAMGATAVIMEHFDAEATLSAIERHRVTHVQLVPTMFARLLALPEDVRGRYDLSSLVAAIHAAAPCPPDLKDRMLDWWGPIIHEYYSGTEGIGFVYCGPEDWAEHRGSVGRPVIGEVHIVDDDGNELSLGEIGTVYFAGGPTFEYHNDESKTSSAHLPGGWATLGDVGRVDADGFLYLTDRRVDLILVGGVNVYPQESEMVLSGHPAVFDVAVIGVPHPDLGAEVLAVVQLETGSAGDEALAAELIALCRSRLAPVKCPRSVVFRDALPREPNGKLMKRRLRDAYLDEVAGAT